MGPGPQGVGGGTGIAEGDVAEGDTRGDPFGHGVVGVLGFALGDVLLEPLETDVGSSYALHVVEQVHGRCDLLIDLRGQRDRQNDITHAAMAADRVVDDQQDAGHVSGGKDELPAGAQQHGLDLGSPSAPRDALPQFAVAG